MTKNIFTTIKCYCLKSINQFDINGAEVYNKNRDNTTDLDVRQPKWEREEQRG